MKNTKVIICKNCKKKHKVSTLQQSNPKFCCRKCYIKYCAKKRKYKPSAWEIYYKK